MRNAIVTGCAGGIGAAVCARLRAEGLHVGGIDERECSGACDAHVRINLDRLAADDGYRAEVMPAIRNCAGGALAVLVNNAAVQMLGSASELSAAAWRTTMNVNVIAPFLLTQALLDDLAAAGGSVVNVASIHATLTKAGFAAYATSKAALAGLTRALAVDLGGRVRVNAIAPAAVDTPMLREGFATNPAGLDALASMHPAGRIGTPAEVAGAVVWLMSPDAAFVTGAVLHLDGGIGARLHDPA